MPLLPSASPGTTIGYMLIATYHLRTFVRTAVAVGLATSVPGGVDARQETEEWRKQHEASYRREYVPLAGLFDLRPGPNTAGSAPGNHIVLPKSAPANVGRFVLQGKEVRFEPA